MTKILVAIPLWQRPEIFKRVAKNLLNFKARGYTIDILCCISHEDPHKKQIKEICKEYKLHTTYFKNQPLGAKMNHLINESLKYDYDYYMNLGSDDLIHPNILSIYHKAIKDGYLFFGINRVYFTDGKKTVLFTYDKKVCIGAGRMLHRNLITAMLDNGRSVYSDDINRALDGNSSKRILNFTDVTEHVLQVDEFPYIVDIKSETNINSFDTIARNHDQVKLIIKGDIMKEFV